MAATCRILGTFLATALFLGGTAGATRDDHERLWARNNCGARPFNRPTILVVFFQGKGDYVNWRYGEAREALERSGVSTEVLERNGRRHWDGFAIDGGRAGKIVPAGRRLARYDPPRRRLYRPHVYFECAGHRDNVPRFFINIPADMRPRKIVDRHGGKEKIRGPSLRYEGTRWWELRRRPRSGTVQRMLAYMKDDAVYFVEMPHTASVDSASTDP